MKIKIKSKIRIWFRRPEASVLYVTDVDPGDAFAGGVTCSGGSPIVLDGIFGAAVCAAVVSSTGKLEVADWAGTKQSFYNLPFAIEDFSTAREVEAP